jgi:hypothetical protein
MLSKTDDFSAIISAILFVLRYIFSKIATSYIVKYKEIKQEAIELF